MTDSAPTAPGPLTLSIVTHSEIGLVRKMNQDSGYASPQLLLIADGMGGAAAGDLASAVAVDTIKKIDGPVDPETKLAVLTAAIGRANDQIADLVAADYALEGMGTTVTGALFDGRALGLAHIGDSRAYLLRGGRLERLTHDHSWVQSLIDDGKISEAEAAVHPHRSLLLKVLNGQPANDPDLTTVPLEPDDRVLLCSDGLCGLVDDPDIARMLSEPELDHALDELVEAARDAGGIDNITVIIAEAVAAEDVAAEGVAAEIDQHTTIRTAPVTLGAAADRDVPAAFASARAAGSARRAEEDGDSPDEGGGDDDGDQPDEVRYLPQPPRRRRALRSSLIIIIAVVIAAAGLGAGYAWTRTQYYVGADGTRVAIFQGVSDQIPGLPLSTVYEVQEITVTDLPAYYQRLVATGIDVASVDDARGTVSVLEREAARCRKELGTDPTASPSSTPTGKATRKPTATSTPKATRTPATTTAPTPTPTGSRSPDVLPTGQACR